MRGVSISVLAELRNGKVTRSTLDLLQRVMRTQLQKLPILYPDRRFDDDLVQDFVQCFVVKRWARTVGALVAESFDDESVTKKLHTIVCRWLIDQARTTDRGSVLHRLTIRLKKSAEFETTPEDEGRGKRWRLVGTDKPPWEGSIDDLVTAAYQVKARAVRWNDPRRRPPIAHSEDLKAILKRVMEAADYQSLEIHQLTTVITRRFPATLDPEARTLDPSEMNMPTTEPTPESEFEAKVDASKTASIAEQVFRQLTSQERRLLPLILDPVAVQELLNCGRSTAYSRIGKLKVLIRELTGPHENPEQVFREVLTLCEA